MQKVLLERTVTNFMLYGLRPASVCRQNSSSRNQEKESPVVAKINKPHKVKNETYLHVEFNTSLRYFAYCLGFEEARIAVHF